MKLHSLATMAMTCLVNRNRNYAVLARAGIPVCLNVKVDVVIIVDVETVKQSCETLWRLTWFLVLSKWGRSSFCIPCTSTILSLLLYLKNRRLSLISHRKCHFRQGQDTDLCGRQPCLLTWPWPDLVDLPRSLRAAPSFSVRRIIIIWYGKNCFN